MKIVCFVPSVPRHDVEAVSYDPVDPVKVIAIAKEKERCFVRGLFKINYILGC